MVEQITAFRTSEGTVFDDEEKAVTAEARQQLSKLISNAGLVNEIMATPIAIFQALAPYASYLMERQVKPEMVQATHDILTPAEHYNA